MKTSDQFINVWEMPLPWHLLENTNILITGATGLIGSTLVRVLMFNPHNKYKVYALGRSIQKLKNVFKSLENCANFVLLEGDITQPFQFNINFHYIIDCASNATPYGFKNQPVETIKTNIYGVDNLLSYGIKHKLIRFLYVSTGEVYGEEKDSIFSETDSGYIDTLNPRSCYPSSKRAAENLCAAYKSEYNVDFVIARPCHIYGPYYLNSDDRAYAQFLRKASYNEDIVLNSTGLLNRSWCYVLDCVAGILYILLKGLNGEAYNISDEPCTIKEFAMKIANIAKVNIKINNTSSQNIPIITQGILSSEKLRSLGWRPLWCMDSNILSSINEIKYLTKSQIHVD